MPTTDDLQLPIMRTTLKGPAVDALNTRKGTNNNTPTEAPALRASYIKIKQTLFDGLKALTSAPIKR